MLVPASSNYVGVLNNLKISSKPICFHLEQKLRNEDKFPVCGNISATNVIKLLHHDLK